MESSVVETIGAHRGVLNELLDEVGKLARERFGVRGSWALMKKWKPMISDGTGFVLLDGSTCIGLVLYSTEYELRFSSFLSDSSAQRLPKNATISACHVLGRARNHSGLQERLLLREAISRLRADRSIETVAVQYTPLYETDLEKTLARMGFMTCKRVRMQRRLAGRIPKSSGPFGCKISSPTMQDAEALMSVIYHGYFSEIDGYLFPDIAAVCSDITLFKEFLISSSIDHDASVIARVQGHPSGCVIALFDERRKSGLIGVVAVVPSMRRRGIGRAMLLNTMHRFQEHKRDRATLAVTVENQPAMSLYKALEFEEIGRPTSISVWRRSVSRPLMIFSK